MHRTRPTDNGAESLSTPIVTADALHHRYCDFWLVDGELELNAPMFGLALPRTRQSNIMSSTPTLTQLLVRKKITAIYADGK
jgi:hypothetical protein